MPKTQSPRRAERPLNSPESLTARLISMGCSRSGSLDVTGRAGDTSTRSRRTRRSRGMTPTRLRSGFADAGFLGLSGSNTARSVRASISVASGGRWGATLMRTLANAKNPEYGRYRTNSLQRSWRSCVPKLAGAHSPGRNRAQAARGTGRYREPPDSKRRGTAADAAPIGSSRWRSGSKPTTPHWPRACVSSSICWAGGFRAFFACATRVFQRRDALLNLASSAPRSARL